MAINLLKAICCSFATYGISWFLLARNNVVLEFIWPDAAKPTMPSLLGVFIWRAVMVFAT